MQAETQKQLNEIKNNNQTLQNTIQESIEKGNARIEKKIAPVKLFVNVYHVM